MLFIIVIEEAKKKCRSKLPLDLIYADDIVISAETKSQSIEKFKIWNKTLQERCLKFNVEKAKLLISGQKCFPQKNHALVV